MVARKLNIPFEFVDLSDQYRKRVVDYMFNEYSKGRTPNPDVLCNREIKFDAFMDAALKLGAKYVATGHYCRKEVIYKDNQPIYRLLAGADPNKDQSYFLCQLNQGQLSRALFPIAPIKPEVRKIAAELGVATAERKVSQEFALLVKLISRVFFTNTQSNKKAR
jgi:tRNA-specific 2-thiouridylase